jgi:hypothetical protein
MGRPRNFVKSDVVQVMRGGKWVTAKITGYVKRDQNKHLFYKVQIGDKKHFYRADEIAG